MESKRRKGFTKVYNAFLDFQELSQHDKMVFIAIKSFCDFKTNQAYPSLATISRISGVSISQVRRSIKKMQGMDILKVEHRADDYNNGKISNLYTLYDSPDMWDVGDDTSEKEDYIAVAQELPDDVLEAEYRRRKGIKEKGPDSATDQSTESDYMIQDTKSYIHSNNGETSSQEQYSMDFIKNHYEYGIMVSDYPDKTREIDYLLKILYDTLNSSGETIRVQREDRPREVVVSQLLKLNHMQLMYVLDKYEKQTGRITNPKGYLLTQLYDCSGQMDLDISNLVRHDFNKRE